MTNKILVCDDDESILEVIKIILEESNYEVTICSDCLYIEDILSEFKPDLILLDLWMKNYDGRDIAKKIKSLEGFKDTPIIFISALNDLESIARVSGINDYIKKPFEMNELLEKVEKYTSKEDV